VPFGEYVPFRGVLNLSALVGRIDFSPGPGRLSVSVPNAPPVGPLICYEAVFPGSVVTNDDDSRPGWLLNLTNDAWFGLSSGPYQHFAATRLRAVEEGLPLVRVANTGISAVIDGYGRIVTITKLGEKIAVNSPLPRALANRTLFSSAGNWVALVLLTICIGFSRLYYLDSRSQVTI
jgi:apolipoprotein N-acyltransferase